MLWCEIVQIFSWPLTPIKIKRYHFQRRKEGRNVRPSVTHHYVFSIVFPFIFNPFISNNIDRSIYGIKGITLDIFLTKEWLVGKKQLEVFHFLIWPWYHQSINQSSINQSIIQLSISPAKPCSNHILCVDNWPSWCLLGIRKIKQMCLQTFLALWSSWSGWTDSKRFFLTEGAQEWTALSCHLARYCHLTFQHIRCTCNISLLEMEYMIQHVTYNMVN